MTTEAEQTYSTPASGMLTTVPELYSILVVDDDFYIRDIVYRYLKREGFDVRAAADSSQAEKILATQAVDAVISDIVMPGNNGIELLQKIKATYPRVPVILMTAIPSVEAAVQCVKIGAYNYIPKPFDLEHLKETVLTAVQKAEHVQTATNLDQEIRSTFAGYYLKKALGEGNSGTVFLAETDDRRQYALKVLNLKAMNGEKRQRVLKRFVNEAHATAKIKHPNIVRFVASGLATEEKIPYLVMEYCEGPTLAELLPMKDLDLAVKVNIILQLADALAAIHEQGICHRDVKPGNIMLDLKDFSVKLGDFGIAMLPESDLTRTMQFMGSPAYMAPEAFSYSSVSPLADIFSLGVVAYELFLQQRPFDGESVQQLAMQIPQSRPVAPCKLDPDFPKELQHILARMLRKNPNERHQFVRQVKEELELFLNRELSYSLRDRCRFIFRSTWS